MTDYAWIPTPDRIERANVTRLMRAHGIDTLDELRRRSVADVRWYWDAVVRDLGIPFATPYEQVLDDRRGIMWPRWFAGGRVNVASACVDRWLDDPATAQRPAIVEESEDGSARTLTYAELAREVDRLANALRADGVRPRDAVAVFMPMVAEAVIAAYAIAKLGAIYVPVFSGFAPAAIASRLQDAEVRVVIAADGTWRRGRSVAMSPACDQAVEQCPAVRRVVVLGRLDPDARPAGPRHVAWTDYVAGHDGPCTAADTDAEDVLMLAYTSGTTGRPKGAVHVHGGFLVKIASECAYQLDVRPGDVFHWLTDMGWIMGPFTMIGAHANGAAMVMLDAAPDFPDAGRLWATVERHGIHVQGVSPTLVRALRTHGREHVARHDLSTLRILGSTGEPWNPEPYEWLMDVTGRRAPIVNLSGGTEVGACFLSPYPVEPIKACSLGGISLGMDVDVFDAEGRSLRGEVGELVCKQPWPAMTRGVWRDPERFRSSYWSTYPDVWRHGDWAKVDEDGQWFLYGRSDEAINVAGKRLGPAEVESAAVAHPAVAEAACVGVPDELKGEAIWVFWTPAATTPDGADGTDAEIAQLVADALGRPFKPSRVVRVAALPRTRSGKILRRAVRAAAVGTDPGDLSGAENPEALDGIRAAVGA